MPRYIPSLAGHHETSAFSQHGGEKPAVQEGDAEHPGKEGGKHVSQNDDVLMCLRTII